ncbi:tyrosine-type recombinase/integrase [Nonomuraea jabiensis]|uniref:Integrase n=1 Tax=Nonomuraea jabiensis TaxID=882448 RepID=A0A7W9G3V9_9ACTN|nr:site-specific integrase [Nonomuraea jabiensis]MBB5776777.1 integrase [Nonomuraea jabiensis]
MSKRRFGRVRKLPSGRFQARYPGPDGVDRTAPHTFATKKDAEVWLTKKEAELLAGDWLNPDLGKVSFKEYGEAWIDERPGLRPKTVQLYEGLLRLHLVPTFGNCAMSEVKVAHIRKWRKQLLDNGVGAVTVAKAYRLLKAIFNTAVEDGLIKANPCTIKRAGKEDSPERPVLTMKQVFVLADAIDPRIWLLILLATFGSLRWGELAALQRRNVDLEAGTIRVVGTTTELKDGSVTIGPPKSEAGKRIVSIPTTLLPDLHKHMETYAEKGEHGHVFVGPKGAQLRRANFTRVWAAALKKAKLGGFHFHDLRHTGNTLAARSGATLRDLMTRMGHASTRAALIHQHTAMERDRAIADALGKLAEEALKPEEPESDEQDPDGSGT